MHVQLCLPFGKPFDRLRGASGRTAARYVPLDLYVVIALAERNNDIHTEGKVPL
jgi:hypothetical protein